MAAVVELQPQPRTPEEDADHTDITRLVSTQLSYNDFYWNYMNANWPVVLTGVSDIWECRLNWTLPSTNSDNIIRTETDNRRIFNVVNFDYLRRTVDNCKVPVADCSTEYFNSHAKREMHFHDFLDHWEAKIKTNTAVRNSNEEEPNKTTENLYLKDWHLKSQMPDYDFYRVPKHFSSDWLNEQLVNNDRDDYRFVYMGPKDSWTPFHADVFGSFSWSTNIVGCKKWILLLPGEELKLSDRLGNLPFSIDEEHLQRQQVRFFTLYQGENEAIFVPTGWYHQVWNLTDTISVNHNWFNGCNVQAIWRNLSANMRQVIAEIEDCRQMDNFDEHCQTMLRASFGINYLDFLDILECIAERRRLNCGDNGNNGDVTIAATSTSSKRLLFDTFTPNDFHIRRDLHRIHAVADLMLQDSVVCDSRTVLYRRCVRLLELTKNWDF